MGEVNRSLSIKPRLRKRLSESVLSLHSAWSIISCRCYAPLHCLKAHSYTFILRHLESFPLQYSLLLFYGVVFLWIIGNLTPSISGAQFPALEIATHATLCWHALLIFVAHAQLIFSAMFFLFMASTNPWVHSLVLSHWPADVVIILLLWVTQSCLFLYNLFDFLQRLLINAIFSHFGIVTCHYWATNLNLPCFNKQVILG